MIYDKDSAMLVAGELLKIKAVKLQPENPFTWASGWKSPIYCDNRKTLSFPMVRTFIRQKFSEIVDKEYGKPDVIAGIATGGIPQGVLVAQELGIPFIYVRSNVKEHGLGNLIEGSYEAGQKVIVVEDLISTGGSSLSGVNALKKAGLQVRGLLAIFSYGFEQAQRAFDEADCPFITLTDYDHLIEQALALEYIRETDVDALKKWRQIPSDWNPEV
ncbi:MAG: orotate phosphoribosyltransferase [Bacteroidetes bacterium]|nr:orotate phosphoribosyltransferase [Bacteroidota bacterium]MBM3424202.1 orotate phosphoribosyltransferase [Bacteroidota bacterium]